MKWVMWSIGLVVLLFLEATLGLVPLVLLYLFLTAVMTKKEWVFLASLPAGIVLDGVSFRFLGESSLFFICFLALVFLYERKYEIQSVGFVGVALLIGAVGYFLLFGTTALFIGIVLTEILGVGGFVLFEFLWNSYSVLGKQKM